MGPSFLKPSRGFGVEAIVGDLGEENGESDDGVVKQSFQLRPKASETLQEALKWWNVQLGENIQEMRSTNRPMDIGMSKYNISRAICLMDWSC